MSLISDALKKAELQRAAPPIARTATWDHVSSAHEQSRPTTSHVPSRALLFTNVVLVAAICVVAIFFFRNRSDVAGTTQQNIAATGPAPAPITLTAPAPEISQPAVAPAPESPPAQARPANIAANPQPATGDYDLGGTSALGSTTLLSVVRRSDKHSVWVPVGKTVGEITAVSYDPATDRAVIRVRGNLLSVTMRDGASPTQPAE